VAKERIMERKIEFDVVITSKDMYDFLLKHFYTSFSGIFGVIISVGALIFFFLGIGKRDIYQLLLLLILGLLFTVIQPLQMKGKAAAQIKANPMFLEPIHFLFDEEGMTVSQKEEKALLSWEDIRKVKESKRSFFIYATSINANIIPKAQAGEELLQLRELIKERLPKSVCHIK
jgi:membrane-bound ClpP family serine protease